MANRFRAIAKGKHPSKPLLAFPASAYWLEPPQVLPQLTSLLPVQFSSVKK
ncbi:hypothetical protein [Tychonema sp. LEGE 06208]|uniref:hypothetical protein n=1 Tax=Tychonema sp. LEGE 06208 TaxID=1828663 RepID=UPI00187F18EB|nr:hypothetical protein [Tychonema sp. LEGE 06208]MBE9161023.1 hypothetical protein [Tychonema sp. LEGE 06208]